MTPETHAVLMSSARMDWETPTDLIALAHRFAPITLDPATAPDNPTGARAWFAPPTDGLAVGWGPATVNPDSHTWINPPYGDALPSWTKRACEEHRKGRHTTILTPARTDTAWYTGLVEHAAALVYIRGRLLFRVRCAPCLYQNPESKVYASRWLKEVTGKDHPAATVYLCRPCAEYEIAGRETKPIARAAFPSMLTYLGDEPQRWASVFGPLGDTRMMPVRSKVRVSVDPRQTVLPFASPARYR